MLHWGRADDANFVPERLQCMHDSGDVDGLGFLALRAVMVKDAQGCAKEIERAGMTIVDCLAAEL